MLPKTRELFINRSIELEGYVPYMYLDIYGYVTTGMGNLIDSIPAAQSIPWVKRDGTPATQAEISAEWQRMKSNVSLSQTGHLGARRIATLFLTEEAAKGLINSTIDRFLGILRSRFPDMDSWPQDAIVATLSLSWAVGPWFRFGTLQKALEAQQWALAAKSCHINTDGPDKTPDTADDNRGVKPRNEMNKILYTSAGIKSLDKTKLHGLWPRDKKALQTALNASGMGFKLKVDGVVGPKTKAALEAFQAAHGLVVDGIAGPVTWGHLDELRQG